VARGYARRLRQAKTKINGALRMKVVSSPTIKHPSELACRSLRFHGSEDYSSENYIQRSLQLATLKNIYQLQFRFIQTRLMLMQLNIYLSSGREYQSSATDRFRLVTIQPRHRYLPSRTTRATHGYPFATNQPVMKSLESDCQIRTQDHNECGMQCKTLGTLPVVFP